MECRLNSHSINTAWHSGEKCKFCGWFWRHQRNLEGNVAILKEAASKSVFMVLAQQAVELM